MHHSLKGLQGVASQSGRKQMTAGSVESMQTTNNSHHEMTRNSTVPAYSNLDADIISIALIIFPA